MENIPEYLRNEYEHDKFLLEQQEAEHIPTFEEWMGIGYQILQAFHDGEWVEVFHSTPDGYTRVYDEEDLQEALENNRSVRVLDRTNLTKVILRN